MTRHVTMTVLIFAADRPPRLKKIIGRSVQKDQIIPAQAQGETRPLPFPLPRPPPRSPSPQRGAFRFVSLCCARVREHVAVSRQLSRAFLVPRFLVWRSDLAHVLGDTSWVGGNSMPVP